MATRLGPILSFRGCDANSWRTSALWVLDQDDGPPQVVIQVGEKRIVPAAPLELLAANGRRVWRLEWAVARAETSVSVRYQQGTDPEHLYIVPAATEPLRFAYASCNGFSDPKYMKGVEEKNERWTDMARKHRGASYHLLLMGGDQVYADSMWNEKVLPGLATWLEKSKKERLRAPFTDTLRRVVSRFYFDLYCDRWSQVEPAAMLASIPTMMMWDDHDIFDGWGSYPDDLQQCPVYRGVFDVAQRAFSVFQLQLSPEEPLPSCFFAGQTGLGYGHQIGSVAIAALDLRSDRTRQMVMTGASADAALQWIDGVGEGVRHLLIMSSIPVIYPRFSLLEGALGIIPGQQELEDDLRDHWTSTPHRQERVRLIHRLLNLAAEKRCRVTILSGDVHVGALGILESHRDSNAPVNANVINQLISSAIVHPPAPGVAQFFLKSAATETEEVDRGIEARMLPFIGTEERFVGARNWMSLMADERDRLWVELWAEGIQHAYSKVIHAVPPL